MAREARRKEHACTKNYAFVVGYRKIIDLISVRDIVHLSELSGTQAPSDGFAASSLPEGAFWIRLFSHKIIFYCDWLLLIHRYRGPPSLLGKALGSRAFAARPGSIK